MGAVELSKLRPREVRALLALADLGEGSHRLARVAEVAEAGVSSGVVNCCHALKGLLARGLADRPQPGRYRLTENGVAGAAEFKAGLSLATPWGGRGVAAGAYVAAKTSPADAATLAVLAGLSPPMADLDRLSALLGVTYHGVAQRMTRLIGAGLVWRVAPGVYSIPAAGQAAVGVVKRAEAEATVSAQAEAASEVALSDAEAQILRLVLKLKRAQHQDVERGLRIVVPNLARVLAGMVERRVLLRVGRAHIAAAGAAELLAARLGRRPAQDTNAVRAACFGGWEHDFVARQRAVRASWQAIAGMLRRSEHDVRAAYDPAYRGVQG